MIFIGLGANLDSQVFGEPLTTLKAALAALNTTNCRIAAYSNWYRSAPLPVSDQPYYVNGVAQLETSLSPSDLLTQLHEIECKFGRVREIPNAARVLDLDLLAYDECILDDPTGPILPHPRLHLRAFVLLPLSELAPRWIHPKNGREIGTLIGALPPGQDCKLIDPAVP